MRCGLVGWVYGCACGLVGMVFGFQWFGVVGFWSVGALLRYFYCLCVLWGRCWCELWGGLFGWFFLFLVWGFVELCMFVFLVCCVVGCLWCNWGCVELCLVFTVCIVCVVGVFLVFGWFFFWVVCVFWCLLLLLVGGYGGLLLTVAVGGFGCVGGVFCLVNGGEVGCICFTRGCDDNDVVVVGCLFWSFGFFEG